ncbi:putative Transcriptional regulator NanR [uncultured delta proteobacterium]|uniref:Putative Transcriptional regulator NanR n=1 Tax=uncultured delta proteobacterium TaxID=34034 RepID=A0A212JIE6_9DELT|nr:putative Transcriptional regulator NanR [uncultured delta proteobacterium]
MTTLSEEPIRPRKLHEQVAERLQAMILERQFLPGDKLPSERELQATFGIGRPAVREALLLLERSGLIALRSGSPATVVSADPSAIIREMDVAVAHFMADPQGVRELQFARRMLECNLAREAAKTRDEAALSRLRDLLEQSRECLDNAEAFEALDVDFHFAVVQMAKSRVFDVVFEAMNQWLIEQRTVVLSLPGQTDLALNCHMALYDAIAAQDPDAAENAMRAHLENVENIFWAAKDRASRRAKIVAGAKE